MTEATFKTIVKALQFEYNTTAPELIEWLCVNAAMHNHDEGDFYAQIYIAFHTLRRFIEE